MKHFRSKTILLYSIILFCFHVFYFFCNVFPKRLLEFDSILSIGLVIFNYIFYAAYFGFLATCVQAPVNDRKEFWRQVAIKTVFLLVTQTLIDAIRLLVISWLPAWNFLITDIFTLIGWLVVAFILRDKDKTAFLSGKARILLVCLLFGIGLCFFLDIRAIGIYAETVQKLSPQHDSWKLETMNAVFEHGLFNFLFDTFLGILFIIYSAKEKAVKISIVVAQTLLAAAVFTFTAVLKVAVFPYNSLGTIQSSQSNGINYSEAKTFHHQSFTTKVTRRMGRGREEVCYGNTNHEISYGTADDQHVVASYDLNDVDLSNNGKSDIKFKTFSYDFDDVHVVVYQNWAITYKYRDESVVILFPEIKDQSKNDILINICKKMIAEGNLVAFEYAYEYLNQYEPSFLHSYAERYAIQNFDAIETDYLISYGYNKAYFVSIAQCIL